MTPGGRLGRCGARTHLRDQRPQKPEILIDQKPQRPKIHGPTSRAVLDSLGTIDKLKRPKAWCSGGAFATRSTRRTGVHRCRRFRPALSLSLLPLSIFVHFTHSDFTSIGLAASSRLRRSASTATTATTAATPTCQHRAPPRRSPSAASRVAIDDADRPSGRAAATLRRA